MTLVPDWRSAWRWFSVQAAGVIMALPVAWMALPPEVKAFMPDGWKPWIMVALGAAVVLGRLIDQKKTAA